MIVFVPFHTRKVTKTLFWIEHGMPRPLTNSFLITSVLFFPSSQSPSQPLQRHTLNSLFYSIVRSRTLQFSAQPKAIWFRCKILLFNNSLNKRSCCNELHRYTSDSLQSEAVFRRIFALIFGASIRALIHPCHYGRSGGKKPKEIHMLIDFSFRSFHSTNFY